MKKYTSLVPITAVTDTLGIIGNTIMECKREDAKTERLEIEANVYITKEIESTKRFLAQIQKEENVNRREYELQLAQIYQKNIEITKKYENEMFELINKIQEQNKKYNIALSILEAYDRELEILNEEYLKNVKDKELISRRDHILELKLKLFLSILEK